MVRAWFLREVQIYEPAQEPTFEAETEVSS
jgi:hypothetical protein